MLIGLIGCVRIVRQTVLGVQLHLVFECSHLLPLGCNMAIYLQLIQTLCATVFGQGDPVGVFNFVLGCLHLLAD